jgi:phosphoribosylaminoimidazole carboxylase PurE protein
MPIVRIILGSKSDLPACEPLQELLRDFGVDFDLHVSSAHRNPDATARLAKDADNDGVRVIIAAAGMAAHLPGVVASHTILPVIGVPLASGGLGGLDALLSIAQMPPGVPVACTAVGGVKNAGILAVQILSLQDEVLRDRLRDYKKRLAEG